MFGMGACLPLIWVARAIGGGAVWLGLVPIAVVLVVAAWYLATGAGKDATVEREKFEAINVRWFDEIASIPAALAEQQSRALLANPAKFECIPGRGECPYSGELAPVLRAFLGQYESVRAVGSQEFIDRKVLTPVYGSMLPGPFLNIGTGECLRLYVKPGEETIYEVDTLNEDAPVDTYPTIHHWVLMQDRLMTADWDKLLQ